MDEVAPGSYRLHVLGGVDLRRADGSEARSVLAQPKRYALLAYLALAGRGVFRTRQTLLGLFWAERDERAARDNLNRSLSFLRSMLGTSALVSRGDQEVAVDPALVWCDAVAFREAVHAERPEEAVALYSGDLLHGLSVEDAPEFERWLDATRASLLGEALSASRKLIERMASAGELVAAVRQAEWGVRLAPFDEPGHRRLFELLDAAGDRAGALVAFDAFAQRLASELELEPSPETRAVVERIRQRAKVVADSSPERAILPQGSDGTAREPNLAEPEAGAHVRLDRARTLAVLPFANLGPGDEDRYFSEGITEDIVTCVAKSTGTTVISASATRRYAERVPDLRRIGTDLGAGTVLEGSVRRSGARIRIVCRLWDSGSGGTLWAETYDREIGDVFWVQSDVAARIADAVHAQVSTNTDAHESPHASPQRLAAYELYLKGRFAWNKRTAPALRQGIEFLRRATEEDPSFLLAWAALADCCVTLALYGGAPPEGVMQEAQAAAEHALTRDAGLAEALTARACVRAVYEWNWVDAERDFRRSIAVHPAYSTAHHWYASHCLIPLGRFEEARVALERARRLDPYSLPIAATFASLAYFERDYERAVVESRRVIELDERFALAHLFLGQALERQGRPDAAATPLETAMSLSGGSPEAVAALAHTYGRLGRGDEARQLVEDLEARGRGEYVSSTQLALAHLGLGETAEALSRLEEAVAARATDLIWVGQRPTFDPLRGDSRFGDVMRRIGLEAGKPRAR